MIHPPKQDESQISAQGNPNDSGFKSGALAVSSAAHQRRAVTNLRIECLGKKQGRGLPKPGRSDQDTRHSRRSSSGVFSVFRL